MWYKLIEIFFQTKKQEKVDENGDPIQKPAKKDCQEQCELCGQWIFCIDFHQFKF